MTAFDKDKALDYYKAIEMIRAQCRIFETEVINQLVADPGGNHVLSIVVAIFPETIRVDRNSGSGRERFEQTIGEPTEGPTIEFPDPNHPAVPDPVVR